VELKAVLSLQKEHEVQLVNYLTATKIDTGLLINFGLSVEVRRKFRTYKPKATGAV
jgi:GxxExxY protein